MLPVILYQQYNRNRKDRAGLLEESVARMEVLRGPMDGQLTIIVS
jgi:hypothetical protein